MAPRHHHQNFPPRSLRDLYWQDMQALSRLFRPMPSPHSPSYTTWQTHLRSRIVDLPSHLRRRPDAPTAFCATHKNLNPEPIESFVDFLRHVLEPERLRGYEVSGRTFGLLGDMRVTFGERVCLPLSSLTTSRGGDGEYAPRFDVSYGHVAANFVEDSNNGSSCAVCKLSSISDDVQGVAVLGAFAISSIESRLWKVSKRVQFVESFYAAVVDDPRGTIEDVTRPMWELAVELYRCRPKKEKKGGEDGTDRSHVDACVAAAAAPGESSGRSTPSYPLFVSTDPFSDDRAARTPMQTHFQTPNAPRATSEYSHMDSWRSYEQSTASPVSPSWHYSEREQQYDFAPAASSVYSHGGETEQGDFEVERHIIDSYRRRRD